MAVDPRIALLNAIRGGQPQMPGLRTAGPPLAPETPRGQPMRETAQAITALHAAITAEPEPEDKAQLAQALQIVLRVQAKNAKEAGPGAGRQPTQGY